MLWCIRLAFVVLVFLFVLAVATACSWRQSTESRVLDRPPADPVLILPRTVAPEVLAAETRRTQVVADIARLTWVLRRTVRLEDRIALEGVLNERRAELERLNAVIIDR